MTKDNPVTGGEDEEVGYAFTVRFKHRGERIRSIAEKTMERIMDAEVGVA